jgi:hypothetical protein
MGGKIIMVLFGVFLLGLVIYAVNSNIIGKLESPFGSLFHYSSSSWSLAFPSVISSAPAQTEITSPTPSSGGAGANAAATTTINPSQIPAGFTVNELSPYFKKITFGGVSAGNAYSYGTITLSTYGLAASDTVDITGWQIKTNRGGEYIPQAVDLYDPSGLAAASDIVVGRNQSVYIYSSPGPFNLRLNKCIGYIGNSNKFTPALPENCPYVDQQAISKMGFTGACENYIYSLGSCQAPDPNNIQIPRTDYSCQNYLENNFNYKACFNAHVGDADFLSNQWWVWTGSSPMDQYHDIINLFDKSGLLVDEYSY